MNTHHEPIDHNHPAVEAAWKALTLAQGTADGVPFIFAFPSAFRAALQRLTADDLRDTDAGRALMAEAWEEGAQAAWGVSGEGWNGEYTGRPGPPGAFRAQNPTFPNPHLEDDA